MEDGMDQSWDVCVQPESIANSESEHPNDTMMDVLYMQSSQDCYSFTDGDRGTGINLGAISWRFRTFKT